MHPYIIDMLARENRRRIDEEVKQIHLSRLARRDTSGIGSYFFARLGAALIQIGSWLKQRYEPACPQGRCRM